MFFLNFNGVFLSVVKGGACYSDLTSYRGHIGVINPNIDVLVTMKTVKWKLELGI